MKKFVKACLLSAAATWGLFSVANASAAADVVNCAAVSEQTCHIAKSLKRGVNFGNMLDAPQEGRWGVSVLPAYMDIAAANFNTIRLPVRWSNHAAATVDGRLDEVFARRVDHIVDTLLDKNVYVILDFHHHKQLIGITMDAGEFSVNPAIMDARFLNIWRQVAQRYRNKGPHLLFEILNEPTNRLSGARWNAMVVRALSVIRTTNPTRTVIVDVAQANRENDYASLKLPPDKDLIMGAHTYDPADFAIQFNPALPLLTCCDATQKQAVITALDKMHAWNQRTGVPVHLGEFGTYQRAPIESREAYTRFVRDEAEARGMGWAYWEFASTFGVYSATTNNWIEPIRRALLD